MAKHHCGRPRKDGKRYDRGRLVTVSHGPAATPEIIKHRVDLVGDYMAMTAEAGRAPEILRMWGILTERQARACEEYRRVVCAFRVHTGMPRASAQIANIAVLPNDLPDEIASMQASRRESLTPEERENYDTGKQQGAERAMDDVMVIVRHTAPFHLVKSTLDMIAVEDCAPETWSVGIVAPIVVRTLTDALTNLADHFFGAEKNVDRVSANSVIV